MSSAARLSAEDLRHLAASASSLGERLSGDGALLVDEAGAAESIAERVATRCSVWCELAAAGDSERLGRRLAWAGWDEHLARQALAGVRLAAPPGDAALPDWVLLVQEFSDEALAVAGGGEALAGGVPFAPLLSPLLAVARRRLASALGGSPAATVLTPEGAAEVEQALLLRLAELGLETFYAEFAALRAGGGREAEARVGCYGAFITAQLAQGLRGLLLGYPVLARLLAVAVEQWVGATAELLFRIADSFPALGATFPVLDPELGEPLSGCVTGVELWLSAPHDEGRTVALLTFCGGGRLIYKPRSLALEAAFAALLRVCNDSGQMLPLAAPRVLDRGAYGFVQHIAHEACVDEEAVLRYYRRSGLLLCLLYLLDGTEVNDGSLIAHGEHPMLIDLATLLQPPLPEPQALWSQAQRRAQQQLSSSVLSTGLLPQGRSERDGLAGGSGAAHHLATVLRLANSDDMELAEQELVTAAGRNRVHLGSLSGPPQSVREPHHEHELLAGFAEMFRWLMQQRESLLSADGALARFRGAKARFALRETRYYQSLLRRSLGPALLRDGVDRSLFLESLAEAYLDAAERPASFGLLGAELAAVERLDVPRFVQEADQQAVCERLARLSEEELARQVELIQTALCAMPSAAAANSPRIELADWPVARSELATVAAALAAEAGQAGELEELAHLRAGAARVAAELRARAVHGDDGTATWLGVAALPAPRRYQHQPLPMYLDSGVAGVALFLAAQAQQAPDGQGAASAALRQAASLHLRKWLRGPSSGALPLGLGALTGCGSLLYALVRTAKLSGDSELLEDALAVLALLTPERIAADQALDLASGAAGAILGLLALHAATSEPLALEQAVRCGEHLLARQVEGNSRRRAWPFFTGTSHSTPLTGFSHGAAGISYALERLYAVTRNDRFDNACLDGLTYERALQLPDSGHWPDLRPNAARRFACSWEHGAPGIGLSRLGMLGDSEGDRPELEREIDAALTANEQEPWDGVDQVASGNFGRLEFMLKAGLALRQSPLLDQARRLARALLARAERTGGFYLFPGHPPYLYSPGFFYGTAGIGYQLLRLAAPGELPSVLLFE